jgi:hypothetical protein
MSIYMNMPEDKRDALDKDWFDRTIKELQQERLGKLGVAPEDTPKKKAVIPSDLASFAAGAYMTPKPEVNSQEPWKPERYTLDDFPSKVMDQEEKPDIEIDGVEWIPRNVYDAMHNSPGGVYGDTGIVGSEWAPIMSNPAGQEAPGWRTFFEGYLDFLGIDVDLFDEHADVAWGEAESVDDDIFTATLMGTSMGMTGLGQAALGASGKTIAKAMGTDALAFASGEAAHRYLASQGHPVAGMAADMLGTMAVFGIGKALTRDWNGVKPKLKAAGLDDAEATGVLRGMAGRDAEPHIFLEGNDMVIHSKRLPVFGESDDVIEDVITKIADDGKVSIELPNRGKKIDFDMKDNPDFKGTIKGVMKRYKANARMDDTFDPRWNMPKKTARKAERIPGARPDGDIPPSETLAHHWSYEQTNDIDELIDALAGEASERVKQSVWQRRINARKFREAAQGTKNLFDRIHDMTWQEIWESFTNPNMGKLPQLEKLADQAEHVKQINVDDSRAVIYNLAEKAKSIGLHHNTLLDIIRKGADIDDTAERWAQRIGDATSLKKSVDNGIYPEIIESIRNDLQFLRGIIYKGGAEKVQHGLLDPSTFKEFGRKYLGRHYLRYNNPRKWAEDPELGVKAKDAYRALIDDGVSEEDAKGWIEWIMRDSIDGAGDASPYKKYELSLRSSYKRKELPKDVRTFLGEDDNPYTILYRTIRDQESELQRAKVLGGLLDEKTLVSDKPLADDWVKLEGNVLPARKMHGDLGKVSRIGPMEGKYVHPKIAEFIKEEYIPPDELKEAWSATLTLWKKMMVPWNIRTTMRNVIGDTYLKQMAGFPIYKQVPAVRKWIKIIRDSIDDPTNTQSAFYERARRLGVTDSSFSKSELKRFDDALYSVKDIQNPYVAKIRALEYFIGDATDKLTKGKAGLRRIEEFYNLWESASRMSLYEHFLTNGKLATIQDGMKMASDKLLKKNDPQYWLEAITGSLKRIPVTEQEAADLVKFHLFDYGKLPPAIRALSNSTHPFIAFPYFATRAMLNTGLHHPVQGLKTLASIYALKMAASGVLGYEVSMAGFLPYMGDFADQDVSDIANVLKPSGPITWPYEWITGKSASTGWDIRNSDDPGMQQLMDMLIHQYNQTVPAPFQTYRLKRSVRPRDMERFAADDLFGFRPLDWTEELKQRKMDT